MTLILYSKPGCHLCDEARDLLEELRGERGFEIEEIDITRDEALFALYRHEIPVIVRDGVVLARGRITEHELTRQLDQDATAER